MKKITFIFVMLAWVSMMKVQADQLAWISEEQAQKAVQFLKKQRKVVLFCGCCDGDKKQKVKIKNVVYRHPTMDGKVYNEYYQVFVTAKINGKWQEVALDLAYVHIKKKRKALCLGQELDFKCDPCVEPFSWRI